MANSVTRQLILDEARARGYEVSYIGPGRALIRIERPDGTWDMFAGSRPMSVSANGTKITLHKLLTLMFVESRGYRVPPYARITTEVEARDFIAQHGAMVLKPDDSSQSKGVTANLTAADDLHAALEYALGHSNSGKALAQQFLTGKLYRLFVLDGEMVAASERRAASVTGDGSSTVAELVDRLNAHPWRSGAEPTPLKQVDLAAVAAFLGTDSIGRVPAASEVVRLSAIDSVSAGGHSINVTAMVHRSWIDAATKLSEDAGLFVAGFDIITEDISLPMDGQYLPLLEINSAPGLKIHEYPLEGEPIHLAPMLLDAVFK